MNSDELIKKKYNEVIGILSEDDSQAVQAYLKDQLEIAKTLGRKEVKRRNFLWATIPVFIGLCFAGLICGKIVRSSNCPKPDCPSSVVQCGDAVELKWKEDAYNRGTWTFKDESVRCEYSKNVMVCWYLDVPPDTLPWEPTRELTP